MAIRDTRRKFGEVRSSKRKCEGESRWVNGMRFSHTVRRLSVQLISTSHSFYFSNKTFF